MSAKTDAFGRIKSGLETSGGQMSLIVQQQMAAQYRPDEKQEGWLSLREREPKTFAALPPRVRMGVGLYEQQKAAFSAIEAAKKGGAV